MLQNQQRVYTWTRHPVQFPDSGPASLRAPSSLRPSTALSDFTEGRSREMASLRPPSSSRTPSLWRSSAVFAPGSSDEFPFDFNADFARLDPFAFLSAALWRRAKVASPTNTCSNDGLIRLNRFVKRFSVHPYHLLSYYLAKTEPPRSRSRPRNSHVNWRKIEK